MKYKDLYRILVKNNFNIIRYGKHQIFSNGIINIAIPHTKDVNKMLVKKILKQAAIDYE